MPAPPRPLRLTAALLSGVGAALLGACGPSFEVLAEGHLRFAHCDRLDLDPKIAPSHRLHCWREWRRTYTYGQTRDRVEYAARRIAEVVSGDTEPPFRLPSGELQRSSSTKPSPAPAAAVSAALAPTVPELPPEERACRDRCQRAQAACAPGCETRPTGCEPCPSTLEECLKDCKIDAP